MNVNCDVAFECQTLWKCILRFQALCWGLRICWGCRLRCSLSPYFMPSRWRRRRLESWKVSLLEMRSRCCRLGQARLLLVSGVELLKWRTVGKVGRVGTAAVDAFGGAHWVFCIPALHVVDRTWRILGLTIVVKWMAKKYAVKVLTCRFGVLVILPPCNAVT